MNKTIDDMQPKPLPIRRSTNLSGIYFQQNRVIFFIVVAAFLSVIDKAVGGRKELAIGCWLLAKT